MPEVGAEVKRQLDDLDRIVMLNSKIAGTGYLLAFLGYACSHLSAASSYTPATAPYNSERLTAFLYLIGTLVMACFLWELRKLSVHAVKEGL